MKQKRRFSVRFCDFCEGFVALAALAVFAFLSLVSLIQTCHIDIGFSADNSEHVSFLGDNVLLNIGILLALFLLAMLIARARVKRRTVRIVGAAAIALSAAVGVWWVLAAKAVPYADSKRIIDAAQLLAAGDASALTQNNYFYIYPFQTGYLLFAEGFFRIFGAGRITLFQLLNVLLACAGEIAVLRLARVLFDDPRAELLTAVLLGLCLQPMFLSTFLYGTIPGMTLALWSVVLVSRCMKEKKPVLLIPAAVLIALAVMIKKNFAIVLIAEGILLLLFVIRQRKAAALLGVALMAALSVLLPMGAQKLCEVRADTSFGKGTPQTAWLVTGFRDSSFCAGWYNSYTNNVLADNDFDYDKTLAQNKTDLNERLAIFASRPIYFASFLYHKVVSQWNEPAYQCIWSSAAGESSGETSGFVQSLGTGAAGDAVNAYFNQLMQFVYAALTVSLAILLFRRGQRSEERMIVPLILLGAALYHALFEAKSQYAIIYVTMMLPYASFAVTTCSGRLNALCRRKKAADAQE